jgi:hypothetical protein
VRRRPMSRRLDSWLCGLGRERRAQGNGFRVAAPRTIRSRGQQNQRQRHTCFFSSESPAVRNVAVPLVSPDSTDSRLRLVMLCPAERSRCSVRYILRWLELHLRELRRVPVAMPWRDPYKFPRQTASSTSEHGGKPYISAKITAVDQRSYRAANS